MLDGTVVTKVAYKHRKSPKARTTSLNANIHNKQAMNHPEKILAQVIAAKGYLFLASSDQDIKAARSKLQYQIALLRMTRSSNQSIPIPKSYGWKQKLLTKQLHTLPTGVCDNTEALHSTSCIELIRGTTHIHAVNKIKKRAAANFITRFYLLQIYNKKNKQTWRNIPITMLGGPKDDIPLLTTETLRNITGGDKLKHI